MHDFLKLQSEGLFRTIHRNYTPGFVCLGYGCAGVSSVTYGLIAREVER